MYGTVIDVEELAPNLVRVVFGGAGLADFVAPEATDAYINAAFPPTDAPYDAPFNLDDVRELPQSQRPYRRRYTVRRWDPERRQLTIDFVTHGDEGIGGAWALNARLGDALVFQGPGGNYRPDPVADWHLFAGDESALPAIAASLEALPAGVRAIARIVIESPDHQIPLETPADLDLVWLYRRNAANASGLLLDAVHALDGYKGRCHAFVHGEAEEIRAVRRHLLTERGLTREDLSCSPYWRRTLNDEAWRRIKRDWAAEVERDIA